MKLLIFPNDPQGIAIKENNNLGYKIANDGDGVNLASRMHHQRGNVQKGSIQTLKTQMEIGFSGCPMIMKMNSKLRIRKLVPLETLKLMGFDENDYKAMRQAGLTDSQIYHCAGDSIVTTVLMGIFGSLLPLSEEQANNKIKDYVETLKV